MLVTVLAEDGRQNMLIYRYLKKCGLGKYEIRSEFSPSGKGSAENWVRKRFVKETNFYRSRHAQTALIVVIDADTGTVQDRLRQLDQSLKESGKPVVDPGSEQIARLVPRRNVETWILCLNGRLVDETTDYKQGNDWSKLTAHAAGTLFQWVRSGDKLPPDCIDSLRIGIRELNHLQF
jgi:DNA polymerase III psi subunit